MINIKAVQNSSHAATKNYSLQVKSAEKHLTDSEILPTLSTAQHSTALTGFYLFTTKLFLLTQVSITLTQSNYPAVLVMRCGFLHT